MPKLKLREIMVDTVGDSATADALHPQMVANHNAVPLKSEEQLRAWSMGAAVVGALIKAGDRRAINDQLWRFCATPDEYPLELRTVYGGSDHAHSAAVLDWALPPLAIAAAMQKWGMSPKVSVASADQAAIKLNGLDADATTYHTNQTLQLVGAITRRYFPAVRAETSRLSWDELAADPYAHDVGLLSSRMLGEPALKVLDGLESMVRQKGGDPTTVAAYLGLHNTAYAAYSGTPVVKIAGTPEARFTVVQSELAAAHPDLVGSVDLANAPCWVAGVIQNTSSAAPYYIRTDPTATQVFESMQQREQGSLSALVATHGLGAIASRVASLDPVRSIGTA